MTTRGVRHGNDVEYLGTDNELQFQRHEQSSIQEKEYLRTRKVVFLFALIGYATYYITRTSLNFVAPAMVSSHPSISLTSIGIITSIFPMCYGLSKFVSGLVGDSINPGAMLAVGLLLTSICNLVFGSANTMPIFCAAWAVNGIFQGFGAPACAKLLTNWYCDAQRGTAWGLWNVSHNIGGFLAPLIVGVSSKLGWRYGMWAPGVIGVVIASLCFIATRDSPESMGLPSAETFGKRMSSHNAASRSAASKTSDGSSQNDLHADVIIKENNKKKNKKLPAAFQIVFRNPKIILLAFSYFFLYIVRQGITSWSTFFFIQKKNVDITHASVIISGFELGGLLGSFILGRVSDRMIENSRRAKEAGSSLVNGYAGQRIRISLLYLCLLLLMLVALQVSPQVCSATTHGLNWIIITLLGFALYGPQMSIGLIGAEITPKHLVGASQGFLGIVAYAGAASAGVPLANILQQYGWNLFFYSMIGCTCMTAILLIPLWNAQSFAQENADKIK